MDTLLAIVSRIVVIGAQLGYVKLYSNHLDNHELGLYFFLFTLSYSLNAFLFVPLDYYQQSKIYNYLRSDISLKSLFTFNRKCLTWVALLTLGVAAVLLPFRVDFAIDALLAGMLAVTVYVGTALKGLMNNLEHRRFTALIMAAEALLKVLVFYLFIRVLPARGTTLMGSMILALLLTLVPLVWATRRLPAVRGGRLQSVDPREVLTFAYPISIGAVINWIQSQGYRMVMVPLGFADLVGVFATVSGIGAAGMAAASAVFAQIYVPRIYKTSGEYTGTYVRNAVLVIGGVLLFSATFAERIVSLLTREEFRPFATLILFGILFEAGNFIIGALSVDLTIRNATKTALWASILGLLATGAVFAVIFAFKQVSVYTIGLPTVLSQLVVVVYLYALFQRQRRADSGSYRHA
jgi:O-antigen/teichoic acid export membrane protein